jgi:hypothetical protein
MKTWTVAPFGDLRMAQRYITCMQLSAGDRGFADPLTAMTGLVSERMQGGSGYA